MSEEEKNIKKRSERMIKLFESVKGIHMENFPGPIPPFSKWLNGRIVDVKRGEIEIEFLIRPEWANPTGLLHGGMQGALIDDTIGMTTATLGYQGFLISVNSQLNYLGKAKVGDEIRVKARVIREGKNIVNISAEIEDKNGKIIATGNSNLLKTQYTPDYVKVLDKDIQ